MKTRRSKIVKLPKFTGSAQAVLVVGLSLTLASGFGRAEVPVEDALLRAAAELDSQSYDAAEEQDLWTSAGRGLGSANAQGNDAPLLYQVQVLQQQLRELSGLVEEQAYIIKKLQQDQRQQYVDLDRRLLALSPNRPTPGPRPVPDEEAQEAQEEDQEAAEAGSETTASLMPGAVLPSALPAQEPKPANEREAYGQAIEWMRAKRFEDSTRALENLIVDYPNGQFTPNAFYWLGELKLATGERETARQNFVQVIRLYPDHQKVPDALYKLGVIYFQLGDDQEARRYLEQVQEQHPQSSAGALAKQYLAEME